MTDLLERLLAQGRLIFTLVTVFVLVLVTVSAHQTGSV